MNFVIIYSGELKLWREAQFKQIELHRLCLFGSIIKNPYGFFFLNLNINMKLIDKTT